MRQGSGVYTIKIANQSKLNNPNWLILLSSFPKQDGISNRETTRDVSLNYYLLHFNHNRYFSRFLTVYPLEMFLYPKILTV